jgi:hypothetical protein
MPCYVACILQTRMKIFFAYLVIKNWVAISDDAINAYAQTSIPEEEEQYAACIHSDELGTHLFPVSRASLFF